MKRIFRIGYLLIILLFLLPGCFADASPITQVRIGDPSSTVQWPETNVPAIMSKAPTLIATAKPGKTPPIVTSTSKPTPSNDELVFLVTELLKTNGECSLPCLWGFRPDNAQSIEFQLFVESFYEVDTDETNINVLKSDEYVILTIGFLKNDTHVMVQLSIAGNEREILRMTAWSMGDFGITAEGGLDLRPIYGSQDFSETTERYSLPSILREFGHPDDILIATWSDDPERPDITARPFSLVLTYLEKGIFIEYVMLREINGGNYIGCPNGAHIYLGVWSPERDLTLPYLASKIGSVISEINTNYFKSIDEVSGFDVDQFYVNFSDADNRLCIETPAELWTGN